MPDVLRVLIVDDERLARRALRSILAPRDDVEVVGEVGSVEEAAALVRETAPDVVLLDIQMRRETGFDLLDRIATPVHVIFVTAYDEYAVRAFEVNALDYLLKPVEPKRLAQALQRVRTTDQALPRDPDEPDDDPNAFRYDDLFFYEESRQPRFIRIRDIVHIEAAGNYTELHLNDGATALTSRTLSTWQERLPAEHFVRIHRSTIVNVWHVERMDRAANYTYDVFVTGRDTPLAMSRRRAKALRDRLR
jgi:two-component system LytT family response regulator